MRSVDSVALALDLVVQRLALNHGPVDDENWQKD
jgi:hypothetical protein